MIFVIIRHQYYSKIIFGSLYKIFLNFNLKTNIMNFFFLHLICPKPCKWVIRTMILRMISPVFFILFTLPPIISQSQTISLKKKNATFSKMISAIQKQSGYNLWYPSELLKNREKRSILLQEASLTETLDAMVLDQDYTYEIIGKTIILKKRMDAQETSSQLEGSKTSGNKTEMINIGYQKIDKKEAVGSYSGVDKDELSKTSSSTNLMEKLIGRVPGLSVQRNDNGNLQLRIRGQNSLESGNDPLILVDGLAYMGDINMLDPNTIDDVSVLKDASATSIYGSRGANGVILITTTRANMGQGTASFSSITTRKGFVKFKNVSAEKVIEEVARWYGMKILYTEPMAVIYYSGRIAKDTPLEEVFQALQAGGIPLKIEEGKITV